MPEVPVFRKHDRYKAGSYRAYNFKLPARYDSAWFVKLCQFPLWDRTIVDELGSEIDAVDLLDVGCATGRLLANLTQAGAARLSGVDLAPKILEVAREKLAREDAHAELRPADAEDAIPWPAESFDVVTLTGVLHHFYRPHDALVEIRRVLRPGGRLLVIDPCFVTPVRQIINLYLRVLPHEGDCRFYSQRAATELLAIAELHCTRARRVGLSSYLVAAVKAGPVTSERSVERAGHE
jgi:ubiquinone/menaquinone biosynthesis C-methylase UbiE